MRNKGLSIVFCLILCVQLTAQLNLVAGYMGGFPDAENYNEIITRYNLGQDSLLQAFPALEVLNGITLGASYRMGPVSLQGLWTERFRTDESESLNVANNTVSTSTLNTTFRSFSLGVELQAVKMLLGGSLNYDIFKQRSKIRTAQEETIVLENGWSSRFYIGTFFRLNRAFAISIQPFVWVPWSEFDVSGLDNKLNGVENTTTKENFKHFGVSFFMYNGSQPER